MPVAPLSDLVERRHALSRGHAARRGGLGVAYGQLRRTAQVLDALARTGADAETRRAANRALDAVYVAEDALTARRTVAS